MSLRFETDCADVFAACASGNPGFVLLDVRSPAIYIRGHIPGAMNLPHGKFAASKLVDYPDDTLFVTYCAGPHCNGAMRGALRLAQRATPGQADDRRHHRLAEGFELAHGADGS